MRKVTVRLHSATAIGNVLLDGKAVVATRIPRDSAAFPLAENGAAPDGDVYEITFDVPLSAARTLTWTTVRGDLDGDGRLTVWDALAAIRILQDAGSDTAADLDGDGRVTLQDVVLILAKVG